MSIDKGSHLPDLVRLGEAAHWLQVDNRLDPRSCEDVMAAPDVLGLSIGNRSLRSVRMGTFNTGTVPRADLPGKKSLDPGGHSGTKRPSDRPVKRPKA